MRPIVHPRWQYGIVVDGGSPEGSVGIQYMYSGAAYSHTLLCSHIPDRDLTPLSRNRS